MARKDKKRKRGPAAPAPAAAGPVLPPVDARVGLQVDGRMRRWGARVAAVAGETVTVRLVGSSPPVVPEPGAAVVVGWPEQTSYRVADATLVEARAEPEVAWTLTVGASRRVQRRSAFRMRIARPLVVAVGSRDVRTETVDVSEGGVGCELDIAHAPEEGTRVALQLTVDLDGEEQVVAGQAEVVRAVEGSDVGLRAVGLAWVDLDEAQVDVVRRFVFEAQQADRASA